MSFPIGIHSERRSRGTLDAPPSLYGSSSSSSRSPAPYTSSAPPLTTPHQPLPISPLMQWRFPCVHPLYQLYATMHPWLSISRGRPAGL